VHEADQNLYDLLGREQLLTLLDQSPLDDERAMALRDQLMDPKSFELNPDTGRPRVSFTKMCSVAGYKTKDVVEMFRDRKLAEAHVEALSAAPEMTRQLVYRASAKMVTCFKCGGTKEVRNEDGEVVHPCFRCDEDGRVYEDGDPKAVELFFDIATMTGGAKGALVQVTNQTNTQNVFVPGNAGTAPSPAALIRQLERLSDPARPTPTPTPTLPAASGTIPSTAGVMDAELVGEPR
jgi:hypothetical protein